LAEVSIQLESLLALATPLGVLCYSVAMASLAVFASVAAVLAIFVDANVFLSAEPHARGGSSFVSKVAVEHAFSSELSKSGGAQVRRLEEELSPIFTSMPKNEYGNLEPSVTRYALHRYFAHKYGWYVVGLEPAGGSWNSSSPGDIVKNRVPAYIEGLFIERFSRQGLSLHELAVFAATLLNLVDSENHDDLRTVYAYNDLGLSAPLSSTSRDEMMNDYIVMQFHSSGAASNQSADLRSMEAELIEEFVIWEDVGMWARDLRRTIEFEQSRRTPFGQPGSFDSLAGFARELGHRFGAFQNVECQHLKNQMMDLEYRGTGRVRLSEFYSGANDEDWTFTESVEYLRALGALDESNPSQPSVIIPNFLMSPTNCVTPSSFYSVCCFNECESLLAVLERSVGGPTARPWQIADIVANLSSDTMDAPGLLQAIHSQRLEEIATQHGGNIPLHGRLFAQWMHHIYPRECPYPHLAHTTNPVSPDEWIKKVGDNEASDEEMERYSLKQAGIGENVATSVPDAKLDELPWLAVEELVVSPERFSQPRQFGGFGALQAACLLALVAASLMRTVQTSGGDVKNNSQSVARAEGYFV